MADREQIHLQLARQLQAALQAGSWPSGLPSERKLSLSLAVSRHTARRALDLLCQRGMLERRRGSGSYPIAAAAAAPHWLRREAVAAGADELLALGLSPGAQVARLELLRRAGESAALLLQSHCLSLALLPRPQALSQDIEAHLAGRGLSPVRRLQRLRACNATPEQARVLGLKPGDALLASHSLSYGEQGQVLLISECLQAGAGPGLVLALST